MEVTLTVEHTWHLALRMTSGNDWPSDALPIRTQSDWERQSSENGCVTMWSSS